MKKICLKCKQLKKHHAKGLCSVCYNVQHYITNKEKIKKRHDNYRKTHQKEIKKYDKKYYKEKRAYNGHDLSYHNKINGNIWIKNIKGIPYFVYSGGKPVHRVIAEKALGRKLKRLEVVHHIDCNPLNNDPSNLIVCSNGFHSWLHKHHNSYLNKNKKEL